jgi:hypothetical protein
MTQIAFQKHNLHRSAICRDTKFWRSNMGTVNTANMCTFFYRRGHFTQQNCLFVDIWHPPVWHWMTVLLVADYGNLRKWRELLNKFYTLPSDPDPCLLQECPGNNCVSLTSLCRPGSSVWLIGIEGCSTLWPVVPVPLGWGGLKHINDNMSLFFTDVLLSGPE